MKKIGIITYHAAHNYGSNLQAYALQKSISRLGCECKIINFRTERQKDQYAPLTRRKGFKYVLKNGYFVLNYKSRKKKFDRFEEFIKKYLVMTDKEYTSLEELGRSELDFDYYVSGSDQIWNTIPNDADDAYFLPFVKNGKRVAYAPSFGQRGYLERESDIAKYLKKYDVISVREKHAVQLVEHLVGVVPKVMPDPTLLLEKEEWEQLIPASDINGDYLFFYTLFADAEMISMVKKFSNKMELPVIISNVSNQYEIFSGFKKKKDAGPLEFLSLIKNAKCVCVTSFHGAVFSILFQKNFYILNGMEDKRIATLLEMFDLEDRSVTIEQISEKIRNLHPIDWLKIDKKLKYFRTQGLEFLKSALEING